MGAYVTMKDLWILNVMTNFKLIISTVTEHRGSSPVDALRRLAFTINFVLYFQEYYIFFVFFYRPDIAL